jgi:protein-S-isoprenylcysteine O-methyltransferase Ste14
MAKRLVFAGLQLLQLTLSVAALILWPANLVPGGLGYPRVWLLSFAYMLFFAGGSVSRILKHGPLAKREKDKQGSSGVAKAAWFLFVLTMPIVHWAPIRTFCSTAAQQPKLYAALTAYDLIGGLLLVGAVALNWVAASTLGSAYDRVVKPQTLVTTGPYALVQHPIYTSYMMLFAGYCMALHSAPNVLLVTGVCLLYYSIRCRLEAVVLREAFGEQYEAYAKGKKLFFPFVV